MFVSSSDGDQKHCHCGWLDPSVTHSPIISRRPFTQVNFGLSSSRTVGSQPLRSSNLVFTHQPQNSRQCFTHSNGSEQRGTSNTYEGSKPHTSAGRVMSHPTTASSPTVKPCSLNSLGESPLGSIRPRQTSGTHGSNSASMEPRPYFQKNRNFPLDNRGSITCFTNSTAPQRVLRSIDILIFTPRNRV
jgi:hypothetical protein